MTNRPQESLHPIGVAIERRLAELAMTQTELADQSAVSSTTIREISRGDIDGRRPATLAKIARAMGWTHDSLQRIADGKPPQILKTDSDAGRRLSSLEGRVAVLESAIYELRDSLRQNHETPTPDTRKPRR